MMLFRANRHPAHWQPTHAPLSRRALSAAFNLSVRHRALRAAILGIILSVAAGNGWAQTVIHERIVLDFSGPGVGAALTNGPLLSVDSVNVGIKYYKVVRVNTPVDTVVSSRLQMSMAVPSGYGPRTFMVTDFPVGLGTILWQRTLQGGQQSVVDTTFANRSMLLLVGHAVETDGSFNHVCPQSITISPGGDTAYLHIEASDPIYETFTALITVTLPGVCATPPHYRQCNPIWKDSLCDHSSKTICGLGCALSCMVMAMTAYADTITPLELNRWTNDTTSELGGWKKLDVNWDAARFHSAEAVWGTRSGSKLEFVFDSLLQKKRIKDTTNTTPNSMLNSLLGRCELVAVQVVNTKRSGQHRVLVWKKDGTRYSILDPGPANLSYLDGYGPFWRYVAFRKER